MNEYLNYDYFKKAQIDFRKYEKDIDGAMERSESIERDEWLRTSEIEEDYKILETFGALM